MSVIVEEVAGPLPVEIFAALQDQPGLFFLDSGLASEGLGVYSFIGFQPFLRLRAAAGRTVVREGGKETVSGGEPLLELRKQLARFRCAEHPDLPFTGGAVGYLSYDYGARWEIATRHRSTSAEETLPDLEFGFYDGVLAYHHPTERWWLVANPVHQADAATILSRLRAALQTATLATTADRQERRSAQLSPPRACEARERYVASVYRIKEYIRSGDVYQVNLAQRFEAAWSGSPGDLYQRLRERSPAPFAAFLATEAGQVLSCSPERFLRLRSGQVETRPIKGTRPRGATPADDERLAAELLNSAKERAELLMIVDLERNDLGRVCVPGSIRVEDLYRLETHPTVFHLVANVTGALRPERDVLDLLRATFPGGSITGAPKIRAMQIIDELESAPRHLYTGAIGYLGFDGGCDLSIAIRTIVTRNGRASYHVGAGIVWDSDPESEYEETLAKGRALFEALAGTGGASK